MIENPNLQKPNKTKIKPKINILKRIFNFIGEFRKPILCVSFFICCIVAFTIATTDDFSTGIWILLAFSIFISILLKNKEVFLATFLIPSMVLYLLMVILAVTLNCDVIEVKEDIKNVKLLDNGVILLEDMSTIKDEALYYKCLYYNCKQIIYSTTECYPSGYNRYLLKRVETKKEVR